MKFKSVNEISDDGSGYGSHVWVLKFLLDKFNISRVIEFGMGHFSTELFLLNDCEVLSIEMQSNFWYINMIHNIGYNTKWKHLLSLDTVPDVEIIPHYYDLAFIDGHKDSRPECVNMCFNKIPIIVAHDYECPVYGWERIIVPANYYEIVFKFNNTKTVVFIKI